MKEPIVDIREKYLYIDLFVQVRKGRKRIVSLENHQVYFEHGQDKNKKNFIFNIFIEDERGVMFLRHNEGIPLPGYTIKWFGRKINYYPIFIKNVDEPFYKLVLCKK